MNYSQSSLASGEGTSRNKRVQPPLLRPIFDGSQQFQSNPISKTLEAVIENGHTASRHLVFECQLHKSYGDESIFNLNKSLDLETPRKPKKNQLSVNIPGSNI